MPAVNPSKDFDPIVLYASAIVAPGSGATPNSVALTNPYGLPMEIIDIRFGLYPILDPEKSGVSYPNVPGSAVGVSMKLGQIPVVDSDVPLSTFAGMMRGEASNWLNVTNPDGSSDRPGGYVYWWKLKHPIFCPAGATLEPTFTNLGQASVPMLVQVVYSCRVFGDLSYRPRKMMMPWVSSYNSIPFDTINPTAAGTDSSSELDLINPFDVPLEVERFVGRRAQIISSGTDTNQVFETANPAQAYELTKLIIKSSRGDDIARDNTLFGSLFTDSVCEWNIGGGWKMAPREYYKIFLQHDALAVQEYIGRVQFFVSLTGYREIL